MSNNYGKSKVGDVLVCIKSESIAYEKGATYEVVEKDGIKGLIGKDQLFDPFSLLCSAFKPLEATEKVVRHLKVVK